VDGDGEGYGIDTVHTVVIHDADRMTMVTWGGAPGKPFTLEMLAIVARQMTALR